MKPKSSVWAVPFVALSALLFCASVRAQNDGPVQQPLDDGAPVPTQPDTVAPAGPAKKASEYTDAEVRSLGFGPAFPYSLLENALTRAVDEKGAVNYNKLQLDQDLALFVRALGYADTASFPVFTDLDEKGVKVEDHTSELTFWINAYNGLILNKLAHSYPVKNVGSVKDLHTEKVHFVAGKTYSLEEIREKIGKMDARALFALTDGTQSGPRAPRAAYRFLGLGSQLNAAVRNYVDDPLRVQPPNRLQGDVLVSPWLQSVDVYFKKPNLKRKWDGIREVLSAYSSTRAHRAYFITGDYNVKFLPLNGTINDQLNVIS